MKWKSNSTKASGNTLSLEQGQIYSPGVLIRGGAKLCLCKKGRNLY